MRDRFDAIRPLDETTGLISAVIETPKGSRQKYRYDHEVGLFRWGFELPEGMAFPYSFGFLPNTKAGDGDPLDVLILLDGDIPMGTLVQAAPLGVIEAKQTKGGNTVRNDRIIARASLSRAFRGVDRLEHLRDGLVDELEQFFVQYNRLRERSFSPIGRDGPEATRELIRGSMVARSGE